MNSRKTFTLRVDEHTLRKLSYISTLNKRSSNNQIECLIENFIADFEKENGIITFDD